MVIALAALVASTVCSGAQEKVWRVGALQTVELPRIQTVFLPELARLGFVQGRNLILEAQIATTEQMADAARKMVATRPDAIVAVSDWAVHPASAATKEIAIVAMMGADPVAAGVAANWARPGGNVTGVSLIAPELDTKRLELLRESVPPARRIGMLANHRQIVEAGLTPLRTAIARMGFILVEFWVDSADEYKQAFDAMRSAGIDALLIVPTPELNRDAQKLATLAVQARIPTICGFREDAQQGCLIGYGPSLTEQFKLLANDVARILRGSRPGELPFQGPTHFEFGVNVGTARALGITLPASLLAQADEVIE
jgi:putative ABC transport system substrate-binding protein